MEQKRPPETPVRIIRGTPTARYYIGPRGLIFYLLAILVLSLGIIGYIEYDRFVKPYMEVFVCCVPAAIIAGLLLFFGFASRTTTVRQVKVVKPPVGTDKLERSPDRGDSETDRNLSSPNIKSGLQTDARLGKHEPAEVSHAELLAQKRNLTQFLKNLDDQHREGLIMSDVYLNLRNKYNRELAGLNNRIKSSKPATPRKVKKKA